MSQSQEPSPVVSTAATAASHSPPRPTWPRIHRLVLKELRETLRDRRTIVTLVLMPILVYPLLSIGFQKLMLTSFAGPAASEPKLLIGLESSVHHEDVRRHLQRGDEQLARQSGSATTQTAEWLKSSFRVCEDLEKSVAERFVDVGIRIRAIRKAPGGATNSLVDCELVYRHDLASREALDFVERCLRARNDDLIARRLQTVGLAPAPLVVHYQRKPIRHGESGIGLSLAALVPLVLILMTITGAVYPAIDLTAGERERGTLETLIAAPVPRLGLLSAKYVAVLTVALLTATVNLTAMTITIYSIGMGPVLLGTSGLSLRLALQVFGLLILFAAFFSAVLLTVTSFARSFKEAQAYLIPLMLVSIAPGLLSLNENLKLSGTLAVTPLLNIVLLGRDLFTGTAALRPAVVVILSTIFFAVAALTVAARLFGTDAILYGSHGTWSELFRRPPRSQSTVSVPTAMLCLALVFPAFYIAQGFLGQIDMPMAERLRINALWTALLFGGLPAIAILVRRMPLGSALGLRAPQPLGILAAAVLGVSLWPLVYELMISASTITRQLGWDYFDPALVEPLKQLLREWKQLPLPVVLLSMAVVPAVFEELFFRGFLFQALTARMSAIMAIVVSALLFGAFHIFLFGGLAFARVVPTALVGVVLGWVCYRTYSVLPGMLLHALHNGMLLGVCDYIEDLNVESWSIEEQPHLPGLWLLGSTVGTACGVALLLACRRGERVERMKGLQG
jgi:sodium transport system permease protein